MLISQWTPLKPVPSQRQTYELMPSMQVPLFRHGVDWNAFKFELEGRARFFKQELC
jgi:hypothetical protein